MTPTEKPVNKKEKPHVVDHHRDSSNPVAARLFRSERKSKVPENRQLDSRSHRHSHHTPHITAPWGGQSLAQPARASASRAGSPAQREENPWLCN